MALPLLLVVEDDDGDATLLREALRAARSCPDCRLERAPSVDAALALIARCPTEAALPALILLDLALAGESGFDLLKRLKGEPRLRRVPVVVLTSSQSPKHVTKAYKEGANAYTCKPQTFEEYVILVEKTLQVFLVARIGGTA